jgi:biotin carboxylase
VTRVLVVGCGFPQLSLIRTARAMGLRVLGVDANAQAIGVSHCDEFERVSTDDVEGIAALVGRTGCRAVTTTGSEVSLRATAIVAARLELPFYADPETVRRCQEKDAMRFAYADHGVAVPDFAKCTSADQAIAFARAHAYPLVVKPAHGWGQRGVARVESEAELARAYEQARTLSSTVVVEAWLDGREYSVNGWIEDGRLVSYCVAERITVPGKRPLGVMVAEAFPSGLSREDEGRVVDEARRGAAALGHVRGPCYSQVALTPASDRSLASLGRAVDPRGCFLFETAARLGGGFDADVTKLASGVDLYARLLGIALGDRALERSGASGPVHGGAIAKFLVARPGVVRTVSGLDAARAIEGVDDAEVFVPVGGRVHPLTDSAKRAAYALAHGATRAQATARADAALACIRIDTTNDPPAAEASP